MTSTQLNQWRGETARSAGAVLGNYVRSNWWRRHRRLLFTVALMFAAFYGMVFTVFGPFFLLQFTIPLLILTGLVIWLLPATDRAPTRLLDRLLIAYLFALLCWPDYLALALPGLPWITAVRLIGTPLSLTLLLCLSLSPSFRAKLGEILSASPWAWKGVVAVTIIAFFSIGLSSNPALSANKFVVMVMNWTAIFFIAAYTFHQRGRVIWFGYAIWGIGLFACSIAVYESFYSRLPWAGRIPSFLKIEDEAVLRILAGAARAATGIYRTQSKFTTSLSFAEFLAFATPFVIHIMFTTRSWYIRVAAAASFPFIFYILIKTDSRLGMVGFFMSFLLYLFAWGFVRWRSDRQSLLGPAVVFAYPLIFAAFTAATFLIGRLRVKVWGTGAHAASNETREQMYSAAMPLIFGNPLGHGIGQAAITLGFRNGTGVLTIDSYYLTVALELGVIGFLIYFGLFLTAIFKTTTVLLRPMSREIMLIIPIAIALSNFVVIKAVLSQVETHPLVFMMLGMAVALLARSQSETPAGE